MSIKAVLDANVIYPASIRDTLLRAAQMKLYQVQLTDTILEEVRRNLVKNGMPDDKALKLISTIREKFDERLVPSEEYESRIPFMPVNEKDRHVLAAAVACKANIIITQNLRHFPGELLMPYGVGIKSPDNFLIDLYYTSPDIMVELLIKQAGNLRRPSKTIPELLDTLRTHVPNFVEIIQKECGFQEACSSWLDSAEIGTDRYST